MPDQHQDDAEMEARRKAVRDARRQKRLALIDRLDAEDAGDLAAKLEKCGQRLDLVCVCCGARSTVETRCDNKWCPSCAPLLAHRAVERFTPVAREMHWPLFVTFTAKNYEDRVGLRELRRAFTKFRRLRWWKHRVRGGVAMFEVSNRGQGYHPHVHALLDCHWLSVTIARPPAGSTSERWKKAVREALGEVSEQWSLCLGRPGSIHVRATFHCDKGDPSKGLRETLKYSVTTETLDNIEGQIAPLIRELRLARNLVTWGTCYKHPSLRKSKGVPAACECGAVGDRMPEHLVKRWTP